MSHGEGDKSLGASESVPAPHPDAAPANGSSPPEPGSPGAEDVERSHPPAEGAKSEPAPAVPVPGESAPPEAGASSSLPPRPRSMSPRPSSDAELERPAPSMPPRPSPSMPPRPGSEPEPEAPKAAPPSAPASPPRLELAEVDEDEARAIAAEVAAMAGESTSQTEITRPSEDPSEPKPAPESLDRPGPDSLETGTTAGVSIQAMRVIAIGMDDSPDIETSEISEDDIADALGAERGDLDEGVDVDWTGEEAAPDSSSTEEAELLPSEPEVEALGDEDLDEVPATPSKRPPPPKRPAGPASAASPSRLPPPKQRRRVRAPAPPTRKAQQRPWWEVLFGNDFARGHRPLTPEQVRRDVDFMVNSLGLAKSAVILDLCCGQGQHAVELSSRGYGVVGYDLSVYQLAIAADNAQARNQKINFLQGDVREMAFEEMFDGIVCWDTSFGFFEEEKNAQIVRRMFDALRPGGVLLLDVMNRDNAAVDSPTHVWFEGKGCVCMDEVYLDWITSRLKVKRSLILDDGRSREVNFSLRLYNVHELGKLLHDAGFRVTQVSGGTAMPGAFFGPSSPRIIIRAQKPSP